MREYKREADSLKSQLKDINRRSAHHDDHLRAIDGWLLQLVEEVALLSNTSQNDLESSFTPFESSLFSAESPIFESHLTQKSHKVKDVITRIFCNMPGSIPDAASLEKRISQLLAAEKKHAVEMQRVESEKEQLQERLESASMRYIAAEKKIDRLKSTQVAKIEAQAIGNARQESGESEDKKVKREDSQQVNGEVPGGDSQAADLARREAVAASEKKSEQLQKLVEENKKLTDELTAAKIKSAKPTDDDYAETVLFKNLKSQHEDMIKRVNDLEATNIQLRKEAKQLQAERSAFKEDAEKEQTNYVMEQEGTQARLEADLARIRHTRDELLADLSIRKETDAKSKASSDHLTELVASKEFRIEALESELERLRVGKDTAGDSGVSAPDMDNLDADTLRVRLSNVEKEKSMLDKELRSMEVAWKKASASASKKYSDIVDAEDRIAKATSEKAKADQKYFAAMKQRDALGVDVRAQKVLNTRASEIISELKDSESSVRQLVNNEEKQLAELREAYGKLTNQHRDLQAKFSTHKTTVERLSLQVEELEKLLAAKDTAMQEANEVRRRAEIDSSEANVRIEQISKQMANYRAKAQGEGGQLFEELKVC